MNVYVLELEHNKIYVGKTNNVDKRITDHFNNQGSEWTKKYKPIKTLTVETDKDEDMVVIEMMHKYGVENVRGGSFSRLTLSEEDKNIITRLLRTKYDLCYNCGGNNCFIKDCKKQKQKQNTKKLRIKNNTYDCKRCGRNNHLSKDCFAKKDIYGFQIIDKQKCKRCGRNSHLSKDCYAKTNVFKRKIYDDKEIETETENDEEEKEKNTNTENIVKTIFSFIYKSFY